MPKPSYASPTSIKGAPTTHFARRTLEKPLQQSLLAVTIDPVVPEIEPKHEAGRAYLANIGVPCGNFFEPDSRDCSR